MGGLRCRAKAMGGAVGNLCAAGSDRRSPATSASARSNLFFGHANRTIELVPPICHDNGNSPALTPSTDTRTAHDHYGHFIGGKQVAGKSGKFADVFQPMDGTVRAKVALASKAEVRAAVEVALKARNRLGPRPTRSGARAC